MKKFQIVLLILLLLLLLGAARTRRRPVKRLSRLAFTHVTVIDATGVPPKPEMTVIITENRISGLGPSRSTTIPRGATVVDARGKFMIPGLWDMHAHPDDPELWPVHPPDAQKELLLPLFLAQGVTGFRDMGGDLKLLQDWRQRIRQGKLVGPHIVACGPLLDGPKPMWPGSIGIATPEEGREAVQKLKDEGADFIKVYSLLPRDAFFSIADEAKLLRIPFAGHVPDSVTPAEASDAGQASEEHLTGIVEACSDKKAVAEKLEALQAKGATPEQRRIARIDAMLSTYDASKADALFNSFVKNGTWITPTLIVWKMNVEYQEAYPKMSGRLQYLPRYMRDYWSPQTNVHLRGRSAERLAAEGRLFQKYMDIVRAMRRAGVSLLAGTDMGANPLVFPGWSVRDELVLLVESGLTPVEALQTATLNPARFLGRKDWSGTIEKGKVADLVLLDANPLEDIHNTSRISGVVFNGKYFSPGNLKQMLESIKARQNK